MMTQNRPQPDDYAPFYEKYVALITGKDLMEALAVQPEEWRSMLREMTAQQSEFRYQPEKWSIKEVLGHVIDSERIFAYRMLRIGRGDQTPLSGFEQDDYVREGNCAARSLTDLLDEFAIVRRATVMLLRALPTQAWNWRGTANQKEITVCALA